MQYYAKTNTAHPDVGFISVGEYLSASQVEALGADLIADMVKRGVLSAEADAGANPPDDVSVSDYRQEEEAPLTPAEEAANEEPPVLDIGDVVNDQAEQAAEKPEKNGRRKRA